MNSALPRPSSAIFFAVSTLLALGGCTVYEPTPRREVVYVAQAPTVEVERSNGVYIESVNDFETPLNPYGEWVVVESYGRCWRPSRVGAEWRPYSNGQWVHSDAGWCWQSEEPWGWATYHYGRWDFHGSLGWIWVPATHWAPAWVEWRSGGGYIGWAPLPPDHRARFAIESRRAEDHYVFVAEGHFVEPVRPRNIVINNTTVINKTVNITNTTVINNTVINQGPRVEVVERASGHRVTTVPATSLRHSQEAPVAAQHPDLSRDHRAAPAARNTTERSLPNQGNATSSPGPRAPDASRPTAAPVYTQGEVSTGRGQPQPNAPGRRPTPAESPVSATTPAPSPQNTAPATAQEAPVRRDAHPAPPKAKRREKQPQKQPQKQREKDERQPVPATAAPAVPAPAP
jgi:hypothetical protein